MTLPGVGAASTRLRTVLLNFAFLAAFLVLVPVIVSQFWRSEVLIDKIPVPKALSARGLTPDVAASRLWDGLRDATVQAGTSKESLVAIPNSKRVQFSLPESGFSMDSLIQQTRQFFNAYQTRITGEFTCSDPECEPAGIKLRLRVLRGQTDLDPEVADVHGALAQIALARGDFEAAVAGYEAAASYAPDNDSYPYGASNALFALNRLPEAIEKLHRVLEIAPSRTDAWFAIGNYHKILGQKDEAVAAYRKFLELAPPHFADARQLAEDGIAELAGTAATPTVAP